MSLNLILYDLNPALVEGFDRAFNDIEGTEVLEISVEDLCWNWKFDTIVSPANSYGIMDGGIDLALRNQFPEVQAAVTRMVKDKYRGFMSVGCADWTYTKDPKHPYIIVAPTMEFPKPIKDELVVYNSMRSILRVAQDHTIAHTVACCGLGTATGRVNPTTAATLMAKAWHDHHQTKSHSSWESLQR